MLAGMMFRAPALVSSTPMNEFGPTEYGVGSISRYAVGLRTTFLVRISTRAMSLFMRVTSARACASRFTMRPSVRVLLNTSSYVSGFTATTVMPACVSGPSSFPY